MSFWTHPIELLGDVGHVECHFGAFGDSIVSVRDKCMFCAERSIGSEIILDAPDGTPRDTGHVESRFGSFGDGVRVGAI